MLQSGLDAERRRKESVMSENAETAILAGGCFWGVQELQRRRERVTSTRVGCRGGENDNPTYGKHPGHAEAVEIIFDPERIAHQLVREPEAVRERTLEITILAAGAGARAFNVRVAGMATFVTNHLSLAGAEGRRRPSGGVQPQGRSAGPLFGGRR
jgi:hypothetical protein